MADRLGGAAETAGGQPPALRLVEVSKSYGANRVLHRVSLELAANQVVGLVGENGAGKTTIFNIVSGLTGADAGHVELHGRRIAPADYHAATKLGISRVFQEQALIPNIPVYENVLLSHEALFTRFGGLVDRRRMIAVAQDIVDAFGLELDVRRPTDSFDMSVRQVIEIARACLVPQRILGIDDPVVLLDEPTSALHKTEEATLFRVMAQLKRHGSVLFVSHRLSEVLGNCDVVYVLKDGAVVDRVDPAATSESHLHSLMVGRARDTDYYHEDAQVDVAAAPAVFAARNLSRAGAYADVTLEVRRGEVLGIGGLLNSGKSEFGRAAAGIEPAQAGHLELQGRPLGRPPMSELVALGLGYVPAERLVDAMIPGMSVAANLSLASGADLFASRLGLWNGARERAVAQRFIGELGIKAEGPRTPCGALSGGNQQKVVLARWLCRDPRVLILDNPTRGVDAGAKEEIYALIRRHTARGLAVILITDELLELIGLSNRIAILRDRRVATIVDAPPEAKPTERDLIALMLSEDGDPQPPASRGRIRSAPAPDPGDPADERA
jgi:ribose transport system ATP-binding protein